MNAINDHEHQWGWNDGGFYPQLAGVFCMVEGCDARTGPEPQTELTRLDEFPDGTVIVTPLGEWNLDRPLCLPRNIRLAPATDSLDAAWAAAEVALPEGWHVGELKNTAYRGAGERWLAMAWEFGDDPDYRTFRHGYGDTPADALNALVESRVDAL